MVLKQPLTHDDLSSRWGRKLVMVASQRVRFRVLIGDGGDPDMKLTDHSYCILERLGRARWQGELQRDLHSYPVSLLPNCSPCTKVVARCLKLIKPYVRKEVVEAEDDDDDDNDDDDGGGGANRKTVPMEGRIMERDFLSQAYGIILSCGTKGISQSALRARMCIGKLESRMICRLLERTDMIKGFMEDEGRQRTTKYLSHLHVDESDLLQHLVKEQERSDRLRTVGGGGEGEGVPKTPAQTNPKTPVTPKTPANPKTPSLLEPLGNTEEEEEGERDEEDKDWEVKKKGKKGGHPRQTYRLLKRKNVIMEAVQSLKIIEGLFTSVTPLPVSLGFVSEKHLLKPYQYLSLIKCLPRYLVYGHPLRHTSTTTPPDLHTTSTSIMSCLGGIFSLSSPLSPLVYVDELSWRRYIPPAPVHRDFGPGWALTSDVVLCLPLSIYIQIIQISFKVDGLEEYLNDPVKQHYLIRFLPSRMKTQLLHKRCYIFSFHDSMQRLIYMGLLQFGPVEKFQDKDQVYLYVKRNCMIVDTTMCEPHYNLVLETRVFERRRYTLNTLTEVDNYWFDLMCVCLNTPLGRPHTHTLIKTHTDTQTLSLSTICLYAQATHAVLGSREVCYEAVLPGDSKGAGGLDSNFFGHLKRNWIWTLYVNFQLQLCVLISVPPEGPKFPGSLSSKQGAPAGLRFEEVHISTEPSNRNQLVKGGKKQKRKRIVKQKKQVKTPQKKKKVHDAADHKALMMMTRQRVTWSVREDSVLILCRVASHFLNRKLRRPFVPWCVVRDLLHAEFEESLDKTSPSVGRRSRYILRNPQTHLNYKICLAEVYQDKPLIGKLQGRKHNPNDPTVTHTHTPPVCSQPQRPHSNTHTHHPSVLNPNDPTVTHTPPDIHSLVLNNLIQSTLAMSNSQMKCCRSFQTFHTYSRYRQEVLCQVFVQCRKKGLVNRRRISQLCGPNKNRALPILPMSYQLSQSYYRLDDDDEEVEESEGRRGIEVRAHKASHTKYLMMRGYCVPGIINLRNLNTNDSIVVESCTMRLHLRHTPVHTLFITQGRAHPSSSSSSPSSPLPFFPSSSVEVCEGRLVTQRGYSPEDIGAVTELRETLERHGAFGLDRWDLVTSHTHLAEPRDGRTRGLQQYIQVETQDGSGGNSSRGVCDVSFISRPWRIVDGSLNRPVCKGMLEAVLYHIMTRPGLPEHILLEHYRGVLQPVVVLDLVQALVDLGCIKKKYVTRRPKPSLFSRPAAFLVVEEERTTTVFYEPTIDCCLRLGQVLPHENNWNQWVQFAQHENKQ
uniref:B-block binding subunit of TFIIIC domain-containing protein n=1 Tax=Hucho hucho TaxID=62062 RepID=A0A4W5KUK9_9TELE